jgi:di/tricarboxylate transporter/CRP-like cAMP-binding protein
MPPDATAPQDAQDATIPAAPSVSAAEALADAPICRELGAVALARLVPELEERQIAPGQQVYCQGDEADGLYLVRSGTAELSVRTPSGGQEVSVIGPPACFGDVELLTGRKRQADVVARTPLTVWKLPRERFESLIEERTELPRRIAADLADRLADQTQTLSDSREQLGAAARAVYRMLDPSAQVLARRAALFESFDARLLREIDGDSWSDEAFSRLIEEPSLVSEADDGWFRFTTPAIREFLRAQLRAEVGEPAAPEWCRRAADTYLARPEAEPDMACRLLQCAEDWPRLADLIERRGAEIAERTPHVLETLLCALPDHDRWSRPSLVGLLATCRASQGKLEEAIDAYHVAQRANPALSDGPEGAAIQHALASLYGLLGDDEHRLASERQLRAHDEIDVLVGINDGRLSAGPLRAGESATAPISWHSRALAVVRDTCLEALQSWRWLGTLAVLAVTATTWLLPPPAGLPDAAFRVLATMAALVALSFLDVLPDYLLGLLLIAAWVVTGSLPAEVAAAGFASPTWFLMLASMAVGIAVERSGLLYRGAIALVRHLPSNQPTRCLALAGLGFFSALAMPSAPGRVLLAMPVAQDIADALRQRPRSGGAAGLALATFAGFGLFGSLFLTGNPMGLIVFGLLPPETQAQMGWTHWFIAALLAHVVLFALTVGFIILRYRPESDATPPVETMIVQQRVLGPVRKSEGIVAAVLILLVVGFATQSLHGVNPAWIAVAAMAVLFVARVLDDASFKQSANLSFLLYVGVIMGFGEIFAHVQLDQWLAGVLAGVPALARGSQTLFILLVAAVTMVLTVVLRSGPVSILAALALFGPATSLGVDPWIVAMTVLLSMNLWVYPQQNMLYQTAYLASGERGFTHAQARPLALLYPVFVLLSIIASIPYWRLLGLLH